MLNFRPLKVVSACWYISHTKSNLTIYGQIYLLIFKEARNYILDLLKINIQYILIISKGF